MEVSGLKNLRTGEPEVPIPAPRLKVLSLADVAPRAVRWLWEPYIPLGMLTMLSGDPGAGKTFLALALCADLTTGRQISGRKVEPVNVLYLTRENPLAECIQPRFVSLKGDLTRLLWVDESSFQAADGEARKPISLSAISVLEWVISTHQAKLVVVDPIQSYFGADVDFHRSNETRPIMDGLAKLAERLDCAILLLRHLSKQGGGKAVHRGLGSIDLTGAVRSELMAGSLPDDPETRALVHSKTNIGPIGRTLGYRIDKDGTFTWTGESSITATELLANPATAGDRSKQEEVKEWLVDLLRDGGREQTEIEDLAKAAGFSWSTIRRAKKDPRGGRISSRKVSMSGKWYWYLEDAQDADTQNT